MAGDGGDFAFLIKFARGTGDPRRIFDAASLLIEGFEDLDQTIVQIVDGKIRPSMVLEDVQPGSIRVLLKTLLADIDEQALNRFHAGKIALHSGDALKCKVRFTYVFDTTGKMIEQKTDVLKVLRILRGPGSQDDLFEE